MTALFAGFRTFQTRITVASAAIHLDIVLQPGALQAGNRRARLAQRGRVADGMARPFAQRPSGRRNRQRCVRPYFRRRCQLSNVATAAPAPSPNSTPGLRSHRRQPVPPRHARSVVDLLVSGQPPRECPTLSEWRHSAARRGAHRRLVNYFRFSHPGSERTALLGHDRNRRLSWTRSTSSRCRTQARPRRTRCRRATWSSIDVSGSMMPPSSRS